MIRELQQEMAEWRDRNFGLTSDPAIGNIQSMEQALGVGEEVGELQHIVLKARQGIRGGADPIKLMQQEVDCVGDIFIFLAGYCSRRMIDMEAAILTTWEEVRQRDWVQYPTDGKTH